MWGWRSVPGKAHGIGRITALKGLFSRNEDGPRGGRNFTDRSPSAGNGFHVVHIVGPEPQMVRVVSGAILALAMVLSAGVNAQAETPTATRGQLEKVYLQLSGMG